MPNIQASFDNDFRRFCDVLGFPDLPNDPRYTKRQDRAKHADLLMPMLEARVRTFKMKDLYDLLVQSDIMAAPVYDIKQALEDPQAVHRGVTLQVEHPVAGSMTLLSNPIRMSRSPQVAHRAPPMVGQDTDRVLREELRYSDEMILALRQKGVI